MPGGHARPPTHLGVRKLKLCSKLLNSNLKDNSVSTEKVKIAENTGLDNLGCRGADGGEGH
jgi:hypothetical protein